MSINLSEQASFQRLANVYAQNIRRLVVLSGAGASREAGLPDWEGFVTAIFDQFKQNASSALGEALVLEKEKAIKRENDPWKKISSLKSDMGGYFETAVRNVLRTHNANLPTFYQRVWDLNPAALLTVNIDGFSHQSYAALKTGVFPDHYTGKTIGKSRGILGSGRKLIVDLHGHIDTPSSWILTGEDRDNLLSDSAYLQFLRDMFSANIVLFYGITFNDISVSGQISYFQDIGFVNGEYFLIKRTPDPEDWEMMKSFPIQIIYLGDDVSWEAGFARFVDALLNYQVVDPSYRPVKSKDIIDSIKIPSPAELTTYDPDEIRKILHSATSLFYHDDSFDYHKYKEFCARYDNAIHLATRVTVGGVNGQWLGKEVISELGKGNFGRVYSAKSDNGEISAIKVAHPDVRDDEAMLNSFRRGVQSMRILTESKLEGVVGIQDASELPPSIIMNYVDGIDFERYVMDYYHVPTIQKFNIIKWICEILFECHTHEMVVLHRDLRPSNVMISGEYWDTVEKNQVNLLDFDLSWYKGASGSEFYMNAAQALGYLAPEQLNVGSSYSTRSALVDVYGVGMLLYFILSAEIPLANASTRVDWLERVETAARRAFSHHWKSAVHRTSRLIIAATEEIQSKRPSLQEFIDEVAILIGIHNGEYPFDAQSIVEEVVIRVFGQEALDGFASGSGGFEATTPAGVYLIATTTSDKIKVGIEYTVSENSNRVGRGKYLAQSMDRARNSLKGIAEIDEKKTGTQLGRNLLYFSVDIPSTISGVGELASSISAAVAAIPVRA